MSNLGPKPRPFVPGQPTISARALNQVMNLAPRLVTGGGNVAVRKFGDRIIVEAKKGQPLKGEAKAQYNDPRDATYGEGQYPQPHDEEVRDDILYPGFVEGEEVIWDRRKQSIAPEDPEGETTEFTGVEVTLALGSAYYSTGDYKIYQYIADFLFDSKGCLVRISRERRIVVAEPVDYIDLSEV